MTHGRLLAPDDPRWRDVSTVIAWTARRRVLPGRLSADVDRPEHHQAHAVLPGRDDHRGRDERRPELPADPALGIVGAAWANGTAYAVQAALGFCVLAALLSRSRTNGDGLPRVCVADVAAYVAARLLPSIHLAVDPRSSLAPMPEPAAARHDGGRRLRGLLAVSRLLPPGRAATAQGAAAARSAAGGPPIRPVARQHRDGRRDRRHRHRRPRMMAFCVLKRYNRLDPVGRHSQTAASSQDSGPFAAGGAARVGALPPPSLRGQHPALPRRGHRPRRPPADGRRLRSDDAVQPALRVLLRRRPAEHRRRVARGADARRAAARRFPTERTSRSA